MQVKSSSCTCISIFWQMVPASLPYGACDERETNAGLLFVLMGIPSHCRSQTPSGHSQPLLEAARCLPRLAYLTHSSPRLTTSSLGKLASLAV